MTASHAAHVIVVGNEKGGSGKSTIALHLAIGLLQLGFRVTVADFDERQQSLLRCMENRRAHGGDRGVSLPHPRVYRPPSPSIDEDATGRRLETIHDELRARELQRLATHPSPPGQR